MSTRRSLVVVSMVVLVALRCSSSPDQPDGGGPDGSTKDATVDVIDAAYDAGMDAAVEAEAGPPTCADLAPVATDLACPTSCPALDCQCTISDYRSYDAGCTANGCIEGIRCSVVCAIDAGACTVTAAHWSTSKADVLTTATGSSIVAARYLSNGDVVGAGTYSKDVTVGGIALNTTTAGSGFVFRLNPATGVAAWAHDLGSTLRPTDVRVDASGNVLVLAYNSGAADLGNGVTLPTRTDGALALLRFDGTGTAQQATVVVHGSTIAAFGALATNAGEIAVLSQLAYTATLGAQVTTGSSNWDPAIVLLDSSANVKWAKRYDGTNQTLANTIAIAGNGDVLFSAQALGNTDFGAGAITGSVFGRLGSTGSLVFAKTGASVVDMGPAGATDVIALTDAPLAVTRYDATGAQVWTSAFAEHESGGGSLLGHLVVDTTGAPAFVMNMRFPYMTVDGHDFFMGPQGGVLVAELDSSGHYVKGRVFGGQGGADVASIDTLGGAPLIAGRLTASKADFGAGPWTITANTTEGFYAALAP